VFYEPDKYDHGLPHDPFRGCVVPRPIGWISTVSRAGVVNLSPFSFFNLLSYEPPFVMFSAAAHTVDAGKKDTVVNAEETGEFVFNMATWAQRDAMKKSSVIVERGVDEMAAAGLVPLPSQLVRPPRVKGSPVQFECRYHQTVWLPGNDEFEVHHVVFGRVVGVHIADDAIGADGKIDVLRLRPISRMGYLDYTSVQSQFTMEDGFPDRAEPREAAE
jgi:flavin reductase (DIM6/NTAB) family NADH-FMN oxidoreductase RutF